MTPVLTGKDLVLEGSTTKIEDTQVPGMITYLHMCVSIVLCDVINPWWDQNLLILKEG